MDIVSLPAASCICTTAVKVLYIPVRLNNLFACLNSKHPEIVIRVKLYVRRRETLHCSAHVKLLFKIEFLILFTLTQKVSMEFNLNKMLSA